MEKAHLFGKTLEELETVTSSAGWPRYIALQVAQWLYSQRVTSIDEMTNLSKKNREWLSLQFEIGRTEPVNVQESVDGTKKYLFSTAKQQFIEAAYIPETDRFTLCVSSQVGCKMGCLFCMTARQGFQKQLTAGEIVNQITSLPEFDLLTNVVYMGMGEPMDNIDEVLKSIQILTSDWGYAWSPRRINVSTIGILPGLKKFIEQSEAHLAISLHSPFDEERASLMPIQQVYSAQAVVDLVKQYDFGRQRRVSIEYIMFKGINDTPRHIKGLLSLLNGVKCRINLIKFHPIPDSPLRGSDAATMERFRDQLSAKGIVSTIRRSRGEDIYAACGLLSTKQLLKNSSNESY